MTGAVVFLRRRRRLRRRKSARTSFSTFMDSGASATITPFNPVSLTQEESNSWTERQQLLSEHTDTEAAHEPPSLSSTPAPVLPRSRPVAPVPPGLSDKQLARIRTEALRRDALNSQQSNSPQSSSNSGQSSSSSTAATEQTRTRSSSDTRRLQSEVEILRREMQQLRTERFEAPPSYTEGDA